MGISRLRLTNFRSFQHLDVTPGQFCVLIGPNASGKSNLVEAIQFLADIQVHGLTNAISMQGGAKFVTNALVGTGDPLTVKVSFSPGPYGRRAFIRRADDALLGFRVSEITYEFSLQFKQRGEGFEVIADQATLHTSVERLQRRGRTFSATEELGTARLAVGVSGKKFVSTVESKHKELTELSLDDIFPFVEGERVPPKTILLELPYYVLPAPVEFLLGELSVYDFDPRLSKRAVPIAGKWRLEHDGSNLPIVLKNIVDNRQQRRKFEALLRDLLPFVKRIDVDRFAGTSLHLMLSEIFGSRRGKRMPGSVASDGTIQLVALIVAVYFEEAATAVIEEPERNLHPYLLSKVLNLLKDASGQKQIFITSHNPEIVRHAELEDLLLVGRDKQGFSVVERADSVEHLATFLKQGLGLEDLYVQGLLGPQGLE